LELKVKKCWWFLRKIRYRVFETLKKKKKKMAAKNIIS